MRTAVFIDGFNLYHALHDLGAPHLKWLDLMALSNALVTSTSAVTNVFYCSAFATWLPPKYARHRKYVDALVAHGVTFVEGRFKEKSASCKSCGAKWKAHEEKETDVNLALWMTREAYRGNYDQALLVTNDSDLASTVKLLRADFPKKVFRIATPPGRNTSGDLRTASNNNVVRIRRKHLNKSLLPARITLADGSTIDRPTEYDPPLPLTPQTP